MGKRYIVTGVGLSKDEYIFISQEKAEELHTIKNRLINLMYFEEKFNILIENFLEYEQELLKASLNKRGFSENLVEWSTSIEDLNSINRRFINILTATRLYLDQAAHDLKSIFIGATEEFQKLTNKAYDNVLGYRVLEALRNYVQHRGLPIHSMKYNLTTKDQKSSIENSVSVYINLVKLQEDGKFKSSILEELKALKEQPKLKTKQEVNIDTFLRQYISELASIQNTMRESLAGELLGWDTMFKELYQEIKDKYSRTEMIYIAEFNPLGFHTKRVFISLSPINRRKELAKKNINFNAI